MRFSIGLFDELFGERVQLEVPGPDGRLIERAVTKKWLQRMQAKGRLRPAEQPMIQVHMLDPVGGYRVGTWLIGKDVPEDTVTRLKDPSSDALYAISFLENGQPQTHIVTRALWDEAKRKLESC